jgi:hypothetical protein
MSAEPKRRWFRATGYPVMELYFLALILVGGAISLLLPIIQWLRG